MDKSKFFFCYDREMRNHLASQNIEYITHALNIKEKKPFWLFLKSDRLQQAIDSFKKVSN